MSLFFFHLRDHTDSVLDPEGVELPGVEAARQYALVSARDVIRGDVLDGVVDLRFRIDIEDVGGDVVASLPFEQAITILRAH